MRLWAIALNTFKESVRNRIMLNILLFAVGLILLSLVVGDWSLGHQVKVIKDFGLSAMSIFGLLIAVFIGIRMMVQEMEQRTIYLIASKPINRWEIVVGKFTGLGITLAINVFFMTLALGVVLLVIGATADLFLLKAIWLIYLEILLIVAFSIFFSSFVSPTLGAVFTLVVFVIGHMSEFLNEYVKVYPDNGFHWLLKGAYHVIPNLEKLNLKMAAVGHLPLAPHAVLFGTLYGLAYIIFLLMITSAIFGRRDLK